MYVFGSELTLTADAPLTADDVTDLVECFVDELDKLDASPDVSTTGTGTSVHMNVEVVVLEAEDEMDAAIKGFCAVRSALHCAGVHTGRMVVPTDVRMVVPRSLQDA